MLERVHIRVMKWFRQGKPWWWRSSLRKRWIVFTHPNADIRFEEPVYVGPGFSLDIPDNGSFHVGPYVQFRRGFRAEVSGDGRISIGAHSVFTYGVIMQCTTSIDIGEHVMFGQSTLVVDGNHRFRELDRPMLEQGYDYRPLRIEDHATITTKCTIVASIGTRAFVGANSVVTRDVAPYTVVAGVPAREIDYFGPEDKAPSADADPVDA